MESARCVKVMKFLVVALLFLLAAAPFSTAADQIRVGLSSTSATLVRLFVAQDKALFSKYGIDAELIILGGSANRTIASLIAADIQFSTGGGDESVLALRERARRSRVQGSKFNGPP